MKITILIPCYNEEKTIRQCVLSCLNQTRKPDELIVIDDGSTDRSPEILASLGDVITVVHTPQNTGNKSRAQQYGLEFVTGNVFITTDGDTLMDSHFVERIVENFHDPKTVAVTGYVKSLRHNWLTACRELDYLISQAIHKRAQANMHTLFIIPGCAGAFRTNVFRKHITFDHDTVTEDTDFTFKLHRKSFKIVYDIRAIVHTQDPPTLHSYINQMRRWYCGGWQNLLKHYEIVSRPIYAFELSLLYIEGLISSTLILLIPALNMMLFSRFLIVYVIFSVGLGISGALIRKRLDLLIYSPFYSLILLINSFIFLEQFIKVVLLRKHLQFWFKPERTNINVAE